MPLALNISAFSMENIKELYPDWVIISINSEKGELFPINIPEIQLKEKIIRLQFSDITNDIKTGDTVFKTISKEQAFHLVNFCEKNKNKNFLVHCRAGISRSSAVCMYLHLTYGHKLKDDFYQTSDPNSYVLGELLFCRKLKEANYHLKWQPIRSRYNLLRE